MKKSDLPDWDYKMKFLTIIDTNVIVSAFLSRHNDSATVLFLDCLFKGAITPIYNDEILNEYSTVLTRSKFKIAKEKIDAVLTEIKTKGIHSERVNSGETLPDAKDLVFYEVALSKEDSFLVTGNLKHFPKKPFVVSPAEMMEIIHAAMFGGGRILSEPRAMYGRGVYGNW